MPRSPSRIRSCRRFLLLCALSIVFAVIGPRGGGDRTQMGVGLSGETNLQTLIGSMLPSLAPGILVFATVTGGVPAGIDPQMVFRESEGLTLIVLEEEARRAGLTATFRCRMVTLDIHSSLDAVGFMAAITTHLAASGIGVNPVSAYFHDHLFVPADRAEEAVALLERLAVEARG